MTVGREGGQTGAKGCSLAGGMQRGAPAVFLGLRLRCQAHHSSQTFAPSVVQMTPDALPSTRLPPAAAVGHGGHSARGAPLAPAVLAALPACARAQSASPASTAAPYPSAENGLLLSADLSETGRPSGDGMVGSVHEGDNGHKRGAWATASVLA